MPISREEGIRRAEALADALAELRKTTQATERLIRQALKRYAEDDTPIAATLALTTPSDTRRSMNEALGVVESARHQMRLTIFAAGLRVLPPAGGPLCQGGPAPAGQLTPVRPYGRWKSASISAMILCSRSASSACRRRRSSSA
jgi:hypothetical protein